MIEFRNLTKTFRTPHGRKVVFEDLNLVLPTGKSLALLGANGAGKSTLMKIISGSMRPDSGEVRSDGTISWPVGFGGSFHPELTGTQNVRFVARIYGVDTDSLVEFVRDFAGIGDYFDMPTRSYSAGMKSRLVFGLSMGIKFDTYLVDEVTAVGDASFREKSKRVFKERMKHASAIMVSHSMQDLREFCDSGLLLNDGKIRYFHHLENAIRAHHEALKAKQR